MEYDWKCFLGQKVRNLKSISLNCRIRILGFYFFLLLLLVLSVASLSYAAEPLTLEQAVDKVLANNLGLKAADSQIEVADAGVLRSASGLLPKFTLSETWSRTDNPLMVLGTKLNQEIITPADFNPDVINSPAAMSSW